GCINVVPIKHRLRATGARRLVPAKSGRDRHQRRARAHLLDQRAAHLDRRPDLAGAETRDVGRAHQGDGEVDFTRTKLRSFPRKRESRAKLLADHVAFWIPAFAGMSGEGSWLSPPRCPRRSPAAPMCLSP